MRMDGQTDLMKLTVAFHNFVNAPTNEPCPSRLMDWWTRFLTLSITRTWRLIWHFFLQKILVWSCGSLPNVFETFFFWNSPTKRNRKSTYQASGPVRKCRHKRRCFWKSLYDECTVDSRLQSHALLNDVPIWTYGEIIFHAFSELPEFWRKPRLWINASPHCISRQMPRIDIAVNHALYTKITTERNHIDCGG